MTTSSRRFRFVQLEYPWALGPDAGRYTIRERLAEAPRHILVLAVLGAHQRRLLPRRRRARDVSPGPPPEPVATSRVTLVDTVALNGERAAEQWLRAAPLDALAAGAVARLNRVLHAHRIATADPYAREVALEQALVARVGYGLGEQVADGRWESARELPRARGGALPRPGGASLRPQERLTAVLGGRDALLACEELTLRVRADVDAGRMREAALGLGVTLDAALAELEPWRDQAALGERMAELRARREDVRGAAGSALEGGLSEAQAEVVRAVLARVEAALRARTARGLGS